MNRTLNKVAAVLAWIIGLMGVFAGGQALLGRVPGWTVISWLPLYNFIVGLAIVFIVAPLIWRGSRYALRAAYVVFGANAAVLLVLQIAFGDTVARESMLAMLLRLAVWLIILLLMALAARKSPPEHGSGGTAGGAQQSIANQ
jgi:hypothetical protein